MKKIAFILLGIVILGSCMHRRGSGNIIRQNKATGSFTALSVAGGFEVEVRNGQATEVIVEADDNLMKYIEVNVVDNELRVKMANVNTDNAHLKLFITAPEINNIHASAAANITVKDELKSPGTINLNTSSGAIISAALNAPETKAVASSGGEITISGKTKNFVANSSSGSSIKAGDLLSEASDANVSSGGTAHVNASVSLEANASSGGSIGYRGTAAVVNKSESSGGEVRKE